MRERFLLLFGLHRDRYSWKGIAWLAVFYVGAIIFGAIMVAPVYNAVRAWNESAPNELNTYLVGKDFETYFDRARWVFAILILPFFFKVCGFLPYGKIRRLSPKAGRFRAFLGALSVGFHRLGISCRREGWGHYGRWFFIGLQVTAGAVIAQLIFTATDLKPDYSVGRFFKVILSAFASGLALGFFEEIIFRGVIFRCFYSAVKPLAAVLLTSAFFAYTHFRHPDALFAHANETANFAAGWEVAFWTLFGIFESFNWVQFMNLFMLGNILCLALIRTRSLMSAVGYHGGTVFIMLSYSKSFQIHHDEARVWWGGAGIVDGIVPLIFLTGLTLWLAKPYFMKKVEA